MLKRFNFYIKNISLLLVAFALPGCKCIYFCDNEPLPVIERELSQYGVALAPYDAFVDTWPDDVLQRRFFAEGDPYQAHIRADLYFVFVPHPDKRVGGETHPHEFRSEPHEFRFSKEIDGGFLPIEAYPYPGRETLQGLDENYPEGPNYYGVLEFKENSRYTSRTENILESLMVSIPVAATHVELWYRSVESEEKLLVTTKTLKSLYAWNRYIAPLIPQGIYEAGY